MAHLRLVHSVPFATASSRTNVPSPLGGLLDACKATQKTPEIVRQRALGRARALALQRSNARPRLRITIRR
jgi:hypothetical protein